MANNKYLNASAGLANNYRADERKTDPGGCSKYYEYSKQIGIKQMEHAKDMAENAEQSKQIDQYTDTIKRCAECDVIINDGDMHVMSMKANKVRIYRCQACWEMAYPGSKERNTPA